MMLPAFMQESDWLRAVCERDRWVGICGRRKKKIKTKEGVMWSWTFWGGVWESGGEECRAAGRQNVNVREVFHARLNKSCEVVRGAGVRSCSSCSYCIMTLNYSCLPHCGSGSLVSIFGLNSTSTVFPLFCLFYLFFFKWSDCVANSLHTLMVSQCSSQCNRSRPSWIDLLFFFKRGRSARNREKKIKCFRLWNFSLYCALTRDWQVQPVSLKCFLPCCWWQKTQLPRQSHCTQ